MGGWRCLTSQPPTRKPLWLTLLQRALRDFSADWTDTGIVARTRHTAKIPPIAIRLSKVVVLIHATGEPYIFRFRCTKDLAVVMIVADHAATNFLVSFLNTIINVSYQRRCCGRVGMRTSYRRLRRAGTKPGCVYVVVVVLRLLLRRLPSLGAVPLKVHLFDEPIDFRAQVLQPPVPCVRGSSPFRAPLPALDSGYFAISLGAIEGCPLHDGPVSA